VPPQDPSRGLALERSEAQTSLAVGVEEPSHRGIA
jgi:hypothetical protein